MCPIFIGAAEPSPPIYRVPLQSGVAGTEQTVKLMRELVDEAQADPAFVRQAIDIVRNVPPYHDVNELEALFDWARAHIRFTKDPVAKEKLYPPQELLKIRAGDCDDISMLLAALALSLGYQARLITVSANPSAPNDFSHVYVEAEAPPGSGQWIPLDAARVDSRFGVEPPHYFRKRAWSLTDDSYQDLSGSRAFVHANTVRGPRGPRPLAGLGYYGPVLEGGPGLGDDDGIDWDPILKQTISEVPTIISAVAGKPSTQVGPYGSYSTSSPYGSFQTPYSPGYGMPTAGYTAAGLPIGASSSMLPILAIAGIGALLLFSRGRQ